MTQDNDFYAPDDPTYWDELAQRIHGAVLRDAALPTGQYVLRVNDDTGWLAARFPLASWVALAAAAVALFVVGRVRPMPGQRGAESPWAAVFSPRSFDRAVTADGAPSIAALVMDGETLEPVPERATTGGVP
jgi:hypothetical protein